MKLLQLSCCVVFLALTTNCFAQESMIFDGKTLDGWKGDQSIWRVVDGAITGQTTADKPIKDNSFLIWGGELADFELKLKFRIEGGNSGIQYRSQDLGDFHVGGYQADIDSGMRFMGILYDERGRGILCERGNKVTLAADGTSSAEKLQFDDEKFTKGLKMGEWNSYVVRAEGNHFVQKINDTVLVDFTDNDQANREASGILALQIHAGPPMKVQFKDISLNKLGSGQKK